MSTATGLLRLGKTEDVWQKYCGFLDLTIEEFMDTQRHLLLEQLELLSDCELGQIMMGARPTSVEEFRRQVPLTTYEDYAPYLVKKREDGLPEAPLFWQRTSGRSAEYRFKWVPVTERLYNEIGTYLVTWAIFSSCRERGDILLRDHDKLLYGMAPPPYPTGALARALHRELVFDVFPPMGKAERMAFQRRMDQGVASAVSEGLDFVFALSSVLVAMGDQISQGMSRKNLFVYFSSPKSWLRVAKGLIKSKLARRPLLPRDLWNLKGLASTGTDSAVFRDKIAYYWGRHALETYACAEAGIIAMQTWDYEDMTFVPTIAFLEFIPEEEHLKSKQDPGYQPLTVLLNQVEAGHRYELVFTSLQGGPFVRYRIGDLIKVTALRNERLNINLPQIAVDARVDGIIDICGFARLTEKAISLAIENSGLAYEGWTARKEILDDEPVLQVYIELKDEDKPAWEARYAIHRSLKELDHDYAALEDMLRFRPLRVTLLPKGAFQQYLSELKPPKIDGSDEIIEKLLRNPGKGVVFNEPEH